MMNVSTIHSVSWPQPTGAQVAAVTAVEAVRPVQNSQRSGQAGTDGQAQDAGPRPKKDAASAEAGRAPLLPREGRAEGDRAGANPARANGLRDEAAVREAEQAAKKQAADKVEAEERKQQIQAVLSDIWKASAAVVDRVLGRESEQRPGAVQGAGADRAALSPVAGPAALALPALEPLPWPVMPKDASLAVAPKGSDSEAAFTQEVVAYDEHGNSSLAPLETGVLIDRRV